MVPKNNALHKISFVCLLYNLTILEKLGRGDRITDLLWISNDAEYLFSNVLNVMFASQVGRMETEALSHSKSYIYASYEGQLDPLNENDLDMTCVGHLREIQQFLRATWLLEDNCINHETGFLQVMLDEQTAVYHSNFLAYVVETSEGSKAHQTELTRDQLRTVRHFFRDHQNLASHNEMFLEPERFQPYGKVGRLDRCLYFVASARGEVFLPFRIASFCSCLETLFLRDNEELKHRLCERVALFLETDSAARLRTYEAMGRCYNIRSKLVHGLDIKESIEQIRELSVMIDEFVRKAILLVFEHPDYREVIESRDDKAFSDFFLRRLFGA